MPHSVYPANFDALLKKWAEQKAKDEKEGKQTLIANGQCARLPQALTSVGHTSRWQPGDRVLNVARTLKPGTVVANFLFEYDKAWYPNSHGWHAALFIRAEGFSVVTGKPTRIWLFDQWKGRTKESTKVPGPRYVDVWTEQRIKARGFKPNPCDDASEFFVVMVP